MRPKQPAPKKETLRESPAIEDKPKIDYSKLGQYSAQPRIDPATLWYLRHAGDGDAYGPYSLEQIVQYAAVGRVPNTSQLKNLVKTKDAWVPVQRIAQVFLAIPAQPQQASPPVESVGQAAEDLFSAISNNAKSRTGNRQSTSVLDLIDPSFRSYVTPWVVRVLWVLFLVAWWCG